MSPLKKSNEDQRTSYIFLTIAILVLCLWYFQLEPPEQVEPHDFFEHDHEGPLVIAHRAGDLIAPGNTMTAIEKSYDLGVDIIELDIHLTKDEELVLIHDPTVDGTTDGVGYITDFTLDEFLELDAGYHFEDENGNYPYRGAGVYNPTLREVFEQYPDMKYMLEIKHTISPEYHETVTKKLWDLIVEYDMKDQVLISSFDQSIIQEFNKFGEGEVALGSGRATAFDFVFTHKLYIRNLFQPTGHVIQLPKDNKWFRFFDDQLIAGAKRIGMQIHYWTINDEQTMREMIDADVDGIITDRPDLLIDILEEKGLR